MDTKADPNEPNSYMLKRNENSNCILTDDDANDVNKDKSEADERPRPQASSLMINTLPPASLVGAPEASVGAAELHHRLICSLLCRCLRGG